jgi:hypothetical protein
MSAKTLEFRTACGEAYLQESASEWLLTEAAAGRLSANDLNEILDWIFTDAYEAGMKTGLELGRLERLRGK